MITFVATFFNIYVKKNLLLLGRDYFFDVYIYIYYMYIYVYIYIHSGNEIKLHNHSANL